MLTKAVTKGFDPAETRDEHGRWSLLAAVEHAVDSAVGETKPGGKSEAKDRLKLAGRIHVEPGERLVGSAKVDTESGNIRLASVERNGHRSLRIGIGNGVFGTRDSEEGPWTGAPGNLAELNAERAKLRAEEEELQNRWDEATPEERPAIERRLDELDETSKEKIYPDGYTAHLDPAQAKQLRDALGALIPKAAETEKQVNAHFDELDRLEAERDKLRGMSRKWTPEEDARWDDLTAQIETLQAKGSPHVGPSGWATFGEGMIPGQWGNVHYEAYLDDPSVGTEVRLAVVPHDGSMTLGDMDDEIARLPLADATQLLKHLNTLA